MPRLKRLTLAYLAEGPAIDWTGDLNAWLDPLAAYLKAHDAFAIRLGPPIRTNVWSATQVKAGIADPGITRLTDLLSHHDDPVGTRVTNQLRDCGWLPQSPEDGFGTGHPQFKYEVPLHRPDGQALTEAELLSGMNQLWRRNIKKAAKEAVEVTVSDDLKAFHDLYLQTAARDHFTPRPLSYLDPHVGLIQFKLGTGGQAARYIGEWDLPLRPMIYRAFNLYMRRRESVRHRARSGRPAAPEPSRPRSPSISVRSPRSSREPSEATPW